ncbi:MAG: class I SAM-dependent methyltransferase, partial [Chloroflexi bacterium]|nr:class I SAM-dependent methyltransferase [Chloroflexota bacterium]
NGRFGLFLRQNLDGPIAYHGIDSDATLLDFARQSLEGVLASVRLTRLDVLQEPFPDDVYSLVALFGVIHHIPGFETRRWLIQQLSTLVAPGGLLVFASWCFFEQPRFRQRIVPWPDDFVIERHDYLLDWRRGAHALRYCHYVDDAEHGQLLSTSGLTLVDTYRADGKDGTLNHYAILQRPSSVEEPQN